MTSSELDFASSNGLTVGVELELQILNARDYNLARDAADLISLLQKDGHPGAVKPEITESMVELNSSIHTSYASLLRELEALRDMVAEAADRLNIRISGGGSHSFHDWSDRRIYPTERFQHLLKTYGYLAKQFTIFGQHVHVGCPDGDSAIYLAHMLARYVPHFTALSASSPFQQGADTSYQSSRLNNVSAFPLAGQLPFVQTWSEFTDYFKRVRGLGVVESMKDFYWDIRPKPEYGTVEVRVFDTPLTVERAALLAAYVQVLARYLLRERPHAPSRDIYEFYRYNRFQACRYGLRGSLIDAYTERRTSVQEDILETLRTIAPHADALRASGAMQELAAGVKEGYSDADWVRQAYTDVKSMSDMARLQCELWMGRTKVHA